MILTKTRLVNSINKSLNILMILLSLKILQKASEAFLGPKKNPNTKKIFWTNKKPPNADRKRACDVLASTPQPSTLLPFASGIDSLNDTSQISFPDQMVQLFVDKTNTKIQHIKNNLPTYYSKSDKNTVIQPLDQREFHAFIGLLYARGLLVFLDNQCIRTIHIFLIFSEIAGHPLFSATM